MVRVSMTMTFTAGSSVEAPPIGHEGSLAAIVPDAEEGVAKRC